jgi:hypothetical protein
LIEPLNINFAALFIIFDFELIRMKEDLSDAPRKRKCEKCSRRINVGNFELHEMKCKPKEPKPTASRSALQEKLK